MTQTNLNYFTYKSKQNDTKTRNGNDLAFRSNH